MDFELEKGNASILAYPVLGHELLLGLASYEPKEEIPNADQLLSAGCGYLRFGFGKMYREIHLVFATNKNKNGCLLLAIPDLDKPLIVWFQDEDILVSAIFILGRSTALGAARSAWRLQK